MENEIINLIRNISIESISIAFISFVLTMLVKIPIKKATEKLTEEKRKAVNIVILFIPGIISFIFSYLYYGIFESNWLTILVVDTGLSSWIISLTIYAIYERIVIIINGIKSGKLELNSELTKDTISFLKDSLKDLNSSLNEKEKTLKEIEEKLKSLNQIKSVIELNKSSMDINKLSDTNIEIQSLTSNELEIQRQIDETKKQIENFSKQLYA